MGRAVCCLRRSPAALLAIALILSCGEAGEPGPAAPPISGAALDAVQRNLREILDRDFAGIAAEQVRVERADEGRRAVAHATLRRELGEVEYARICDALSEAAEAVLEEGQSLEVHLLRADAVLHSCGL